MGKLKRNIAKDDDESRRFVVINWTNVEMSYSRRRCSQGIRQYAVCCPNCGLFLNAPVQLCLGRTLVPSDSFEFEHYKRSLKDFSRKFQLIRLISVEAPKVL